MTRWLLCLTLLAAPALAQDKKISALPDGSPGQATDAIPIARAGANYKLPFSAFATAFSGGSFTSPLLAPAANNCASIPYSFTGDGNTGLCTSAADTWDLYTAGASRLSGNATAITSTVPIYAPNLGKVTAGGGVGEANIGGVIYSTAAAVATPATGAQTLWTYALPANTLDAAGRGVRITVVGYTAINGNDKTMELNFGTLTVAATTTGGWNNQAFVLTATILKVSANLQTTLGKSEIGGLSNGTITKRILLYTAASGFGNQTDTAAINIAFVATAETAASDITFQYAIVEVLN